jgi:chromosome segregation ATPase
MLNDNAATARQLSVDAQEQIVTAAGTIEKLEQRVAGLSELDLKTRDASAQLQTVNALAEHVASKVKALEHQQQTIEHALVESRKVAEMVWNMEAQIVKLNEGSAITARVEETVGKLEQLQRESTAELQEALSTRQKLTDTFDAQRRDAMELVQFVQRHVDHLAVNKNEIDTLSERVVVAQSALAGVEQRLHHVSTIDAGVSGLGEKVEQLSTRFSQLMAEAQALEHKQGMLSPLEQRLDAADAAAKSIGYQIDGLAERRAELETLSARFAEFDAIYGRASALTDTLRTDKQQLARFVDQTTSFMQDAASIAGKIETLKTSVDEAEVIALKATSLTPKVHELSDHVERLTPRLQIIDHVQARLSELHQLSADIDRKLAEQLSRQAQLDSIHLACDGLSTRLTDAQHALTALSASQTALAGIPEQIAALETDIRNTAHRVQGLHRDEETLTAQERRLTSLNDSAVGLATELAERIDLLRGAQTELANTSALKEQLFNELAQLQGMHRETFTARREADNHLQQLSARYQQIEDRRGHVALAERTVEAVERRINELERVSDAVDKKIDAIASRERIVEAVKQQVETIHAVALKTQEDLASVAAGQSDLASGRAEVQRVLADLAELSAKTADVEARAAIVNDVRRKADAVFCLLDDMRVTLDSVSEQKAMVDHVAEQLVRLDDSIAEARGTTKALQAERKLAQRIVENVRSVHARAGRESRSVG